jgi:hypothetical protein
MRMHLASGGATGGSEGGSFAPGARGRGRQKSRVVAAKEGGDKYDKYHICPRAPETLAPPARHCIWHNNNHTKISTCMHFAFRKQLARSSCCCIIKPINVRIW